MVETSLAKATAPLNTSSHFKLIDGKDYRVAGGPLDTLVFRTAFGHRRAYRAMTDLGERDLAEVPSSVAAHIPVGPPMPRAVSLNSQDLLATSIEIDTIRESLCQDFSGRGYEIGAGSRPTIVPAQCSVRYIDRFTFEEAKDGSFQGLHQAAFVHVSYYEAMDDLRSIPFMTANFVIACHVIEHVPDVIGALRAAISRLIDGGVLFLVVPHKEFMFDASRPTTTLEHFVADDLLAEPPMLDHYLEYSRRAKAILQWLDDGSAMHLAKADFHAHTFTPDSMRELLSHVQSAIGFSSYEVREPAHKQTIFEFYVKIIR
jgi:SAM-dependent methyltransferase